MVDRKNRLHFSHEMGGFVISPGYREEREHVVIVTQDKCPDSGKKNALIKPQLFTCFQVAY